MILGQAFADARLPQAPMGTLDFGRPVQMSKHASIACVTLVRQLRHSVPNRTARPPFQSVAAR